MEAAVSCTTQLTNGVGICELYNLWISYLGVLTGIRCDRDGIEHRGDCLSTETEHRFCL